MVWFSGSGILVFFLLEEFPGIPKREGEDEKLGWQM